MILIPKSHSLFILVIATIFITSCEKVVDLDLEKAQQMLVIEAIVYDSLGDNFVKLTKSRSFNDNNMGYEAVSGAVITVTDNLGNSFLLTENEPGNYSSSTLEGISGRTYLLTVNVNGKTITAQSFMNPKVNLDSLSHEKLELDLHTGSSSNTETSIYRVNTYFYDTPNYTNYYRIKAFNKGVQEKGYIILNDDLADGDHVVFPVFQSVFEEDDTVVVQLLSIDEVNYRYFNAIAYSQSGEVPGNPKTNLVGNDVVGYFGVYAKSEKSIIITPLP